MELTKGFQDEMRVPRPVVTWNLFSIQDSHAVSWHLSEVMAWFLHHAPGAHLSWKGDRCQCRNRFGIYPLHDRWYSADATAGLLQIKRRLQALIVPEVLTTNSLLDFLYAWTLLVLLAAIRCPRHGICVPLLADTYGFSAHTRKQNLIGLIRMDLIAASHSPTMLPTELMFSNTTVTPCSKVPFSLGTAVSLLSKSGQRPQSFGSEWSPAESTHSVSSYLGCFVRSIDERSNAVHALFMRT